MVLRVLAALLLIPLADALLLVYVATRIGAVPTVALVVLTALVGLLFVRAEGRHTLRRLQEKAARGEPPTDELLDGGLLIAAGAFLLTPGLVTDAIGFLLVLPPTRYPIRIALKRWVIVPRLDERSDGFVTGRVYTAGFPGGGDGEDRGTGPWPGGPDGSDDEPVDLGSEAYSIDVEEDDDDPKGNA